MFTYYLKIAWRSLAKNKAFSFIGMSGLCLGMTCSLFIFLWVKDEISYDRFQERGDRLFRAMLNNVDKDGSISGTYSYSPGLLAEGLKRKVPEVEYAATVTDEWDMVTTVGKETQKEKGRYAGADFFHMFTFPLVAGDPSTALSSPDNIVISERLARQWFLHQDPIGKRVRIDNKRDYIVSAVARDVPENSSIRFDLVLPITHCFEDNTWMIATWDNLGPDTYVMLHSHADQGRVRSKLLHFLEKQSPADKGMWLTLQPYKDMYLYSRFTKGIPDGGRIDYVRLFALVAGFILLIACINFINLATARSVKRAKEVGVRKSVGALRGTLVRQFLTESFLMAFLSMSISFGLVLWWLPSFNHLADKHIVLHPDAGILITVLVITLVTGLIAGSYPALFLSSLKPVSVLKGSQPSGRPGKAFLRKGLVVLQFTLSIALIICVVVVNNQMHYIQTKNLGIDRTNIVYVPIEGDLGKHFGSFRHDIEQSGTVEGIAMLGNIPTNVNWFSNEIQWEGKAPDEKMGMAELDVSDDFMSVMKVGLAQGRSFSRVYATDSSNFMLNETAVKALHLAHPIGSFFSHKGTKGKIVGVVKDFHLQSLHNPVVPLFITFQPEITDGVAAIRIGTGKTKTALAVIQKAFTQYNPLFPFEFQFADDLFREQYHNELMVEQLANIFAILAVAISCLGLFGLAMFVAEQRTREIGIRKVLGASLTDLFALLSGDFLKPVMLAALISFPLGWWVMQKWLQGFAYKTTIGWGVFALSAGLALGITLISVSYQVVRATLADPAKSLRTEG